MAHFVKLSVLDTSQLDYRGRDNGKYNPQLINLDMVFSVEQSTCHCLIFTNNNSTHPIWVKESLDEIIEMSRGCNKVLKG